ncbi:MAG TPA: tetratricopeptide repeat protein [Nitrospirota bacterium]|nr:tetratricopeptide repeat protein [Nitrospirota bacterium]
MTFFRCIILSAVACIAIVASCSREQEATGVGPSEDKSVFEEQKALVAKDPKNEDAWYHIADLYERAGLYAEEVDALNKVLEINPAHRYAYLKLGTAYSRLDRHEDAIKVYLKAKKYYAAYAPLHNNLGVAYGRTGKVDQEIRELKKAISLRPSYATARYNLGMAYLKKGDRKAALAVHRDLERYDTTAAKSLKQEIDKKGK